VSTGLELIPLGIALIGMLSQSVHSRYNELEQSQTEEQQTAVLATRMVDSRILESALRDLAIDAEKTSAGFVIQLKTGELHLQLSGEGSFRAHFDRETAEEALNTIHELEGRYSQLFQHFLTQQFLSNADKAGMPIEQVASNDGIIRLRVTVS